ncbi:MAG: glycoside hydrolase family 15 protein, partial [Bdellovibrionota bacterium]
MKAQNERHSYKLGVIGNCSYIALVDTKANVSWLCWPRFDSNFVFGSLVGGEQGGEFSVTPTGGPFTTKQSYLENTNILVTEFECTDGKFEVIDFAPRFFRSERIHKPLMHFRRIRHVSGRPRIRVRCNPVGDNGKIKPTVALGSNHIRYLGLAEPLRLTTNASLTYIVDDREFILSHDLYFNLSWGIELEAALVPTYEDFYRRTQEYWWKWVERCTLPDIFQKEVIRSALVLKLHQYEDTGGIIAATTTSLPEIPGHSRNWDYRFCWLRDSYYSLSAFNSLGHFEEMEKYSHFIENLGFENAEHFQPVYRITSESEMHEIELDLPGYLDSKPVRIGNQAALQVQHDAYGQILLTLFYLYSDHRIVRRKERFSSNLIRFLVERIHSTMEEPDNGLWEFRGRTNLHCYTHLFHWAGSAAAMRIGQMMGDQELEKRATKCFNMASEHMEKYLDSDRGVYTQVRGVKELDASLLQMVTLGYFADKPRELARSHVLAIEKELTIDTEGFLLRYRHADDFGTQETAFLICSYWLVESLVTVGET